MTLKDSKEWNRWEGNYKSLKVWMRCVCRKSPWTHSGPVVKEGYRLNLLIPHISSEGTFICQVINCDEKMNEYSEGNIELNVAVPSEILSSFYKGAKAILKAGKFVLAECEIEAFKENII